MKVNDLINCRNSGTLMQKDLNIISDLSLEEKLSEPTTVEISPSAAEERTTASADTATQPTARTEDVGTGGTAAKQRLDTEGNLITLSQRAMLKLVNC